MSKYQHSDDNADDHHHCDTLDLSRPAIADDETGSPPATRRPGSAPLRRQLSRRLDPVSQIIPYSIDITANEIRLTTAAATNSHLDDVVDRRTASDWALHGRIQQRTQNGNNGSPLRCDDAVGPTAAPEKMPEQGAATLCIWPRRRRSRASTAHTSRTTSSGVSSKRSYDTDVAAQLWTVSARLVGLVRTSSRPSRACDRYSQELSQLRVQNRPLRVRNGLGSYRLQPRTWQGNDRSPHRFLPTSLQKLSAATNPRRLGHWLARDGHHCIGRSAAKQALTRSEEMSVTTTDLWRMSATDLAYAIRSRGGSRP